jgi:hypothetical protein
MFKDRKKDMKSFDFIKIESQMKRNYEEAGLNTLDFIDITSLFGIDNSEIPNSIFLGNINAEEMNKENMMLVIVMNTNNVDYYYDSLYSYIESNKMNLDNEKILKLFDSAILKKGLNYVYLIIAENAKLVEKELNAI